MMIKTSLTIITIGLFVFAPIHTTYALSSEEASFLQGIMQKISNYQTDNQLLTMVPFYSQISDITNPVWRGVSCGVASLAMLIDYHTDPVDPDTLLEDGLASGAYSHSVGWYHNGLIELARSYGLDGETKHLGHDDQSALIQLEHELESGPVMASVHYTLDPSNPISHLIVVNEIKDDVVYYNDPAEPTGNSTADIAKFSNAWKKRIIKIQPTT